MGILGTAYHETGHAFCLVKFGLPLRRVSIKKTDPTLAGCTLLQNSTDLWRNPSQGARVALAGAVFEKVLAGVEEGSDVLKGLEFDWGWRNDLGLAKDLLRWAGVAYSTDIEKIIIDARRSIVELIKQDKYRINRIAMALCRFGELTEVEVKRWGWPELFPAALPAASNQTRETNPRRTIVAELEPGRPMTEFHTANPPLQKRAEHATALIEARFSLPELEKAVQERIQSGVSSEVRFSLDDVIDSELQRYRSGAARRELTSARKSHAPPRSQREWLNHGLVEVEKFQLLPGE